MRVKRILFPIDFSQQCSEFGAYVAGVAKRFDAELTLLHAIETVSPALCGLDPGMSVASEYAEAIAEQREINLETFLRDELVSLRVKRVSKRGDAATVISRYAESNGIDLIMMPTHGYGPFRGLLLGSVTAKVLHDTDCPVWTSAHEEVAGNPKGPAFRNILCCVDLTPESLPLLQSAAVIAEQLGAELRLVHAVRAIEAAAELVTFDAGTSEIDELQRAAGTSAEFCLATGNVAKVVRTAAQRQHADLVIVGRGRINETLGRLRTNTYSIIRESPCPVLSVYPGPRRDALSADDAVAIAECLTRR